MFRNTVAVLALVSCAAVAAAQVPVYNPHWFKENNKDYVERCTKFYEFKYLPPAAEKMAKVTSSPALTEGVAADLLKDHIYRFLNFQVACNGAMTRVEWAALVDQFDESVKKVVKNDKAYQRFLKWRKNTDRDENAMEFLFNDTSHLPVDLGKDLADAGWTVTSILDPRELGQYEARASFAPNQVIVLKNAKMPKSTLTLLVYPTERIKLMQAGVGPNAKGKLDPSLQPFWQVHAYVIYSLERDLSPAQAEVAKHLRSNWTFP